MPKYLFTSDQRISALPDRIKWVAEYINSGNNVSEITDKSDNNNAATLKFYYNLHRGTETCEKAAENPVFAIRNFVLKFQFPNVRTQESLQNTIKERLLLAPYRSVVSLLVALTEITNSDTSSMSINEILYYVFCNPTVYYNPTVNYKEIAAEILDSRKQNKELENAVDSLLEWNQYGRQSRELINVLTYTSKCFSFSKGILKYSTTHDDYLIDKNYIEELITFNKFWYPTDIYDFNLATLEYISYMNTVNTPYSVVEFTPNIAETKKEVELKPLQRIFYGAPGTGKSHGIKETEANFSKVIRTTFHPDSDYSTFVGAYKPIMEECEVKVTPVVINNGINLDQNNGTYKEKRITYSFVKQAFLKAYIEAWNRHNKGENVLLVIEEINRGNCAQIFGDLFQLLDRNDEGFSDYPILADEDLRKVLAEEFVNLENIPENIKSGEDLLLPNNLYIWATMNTSDQSLFPIDSAFKRRWDWKYVKIKDEKKNWKIDIELGDENVDWWAFIQKINAIIASMTSSADKQLGYFFCKADKDGVISTETFVSKVIFYLWNDVFKDYGFEDASLFRYKVKEGEKEVEKDLTFPDFYDEDGESVNTERLGDFIQKVMDWQNREENI